MTKPLERIQARRLRREHGMPLKRIAARLSVSVGTAHRWTKDIELTEEQRERNRTGPNGPQSPDRIAKRVAAWRRKHRARRLAFQEEGRTAARLGDPLHQAGCMLYWAEGAKDRNSAKFANSDPNMVLFFRRFLTDALGVPSGDIRLRLNVYLGNGRSLREIERYWLGLLGLTPTALRGHTLNNQPTSSSGKKKDRLPYGVCTLTVNDTRIAQHIYGAIQEYGGFDAPGWLDGPPRKPRKKRVRQLAAE